MIIDLGQPRGLVYHWLLRARVSTAHRVMVQGAWHELGQPHYRGSPYRMLG